ncbi:MAG: hypothetical protein II669_03715 [Elusimicrobia bacterium]|nr:hypothetical protein [Elusimicrobiota bacterium]
MGIFSNDEHLSGEELYSLLKEKTLEEKYKDLKKNYAKLQQRLNESETKYNRLIDKLAKNKYYIKLRLQGKI